ncbi:MULTISPECIES: NAD(P)H-quinone oxidoreductase [unclassified Streptomyces]|uniref:NAD(P)H-quinone oxidoreductase n=1 Tax=unclassified Streptomyces TaxID=2593676 RepID=UPI003D933483
MERDREPVLAIQVTGAGSADDLEWVPVPAPALRAGEVLVDVAATAVNRADLRQRAGAYPVPAGASEILGLECSGRILAVAPDVTGWSVGDQVCALLDGGGYAEQVAVPATQLMPVPVGVTLEEAAALPEVACTAYSNLTMQAGLGPGQSVLIHGGGSGLGTLAVQYAVALGVTVLVTVGSARKAEACEALGATAINYRTESFLDRVRELTSGEGVDVVLDCVGGPYLAPNIDALKLEGQLLLVGLLGGRAAELDLEAVMRRRLTVRGSTLRARSAEAKAEIVAGTVAGLWPLVAGGQVRPVVDRVMQVEEAGAAHRLVEAGQNIGKVVLRVA